jgi:hypothetical protein
MNPAMLEWAGLVTQSFSPMEYIPKSAKEKIEFILPAPTTSSRKYMLPPWNPLYSTTSNDLEQPLAMVT